jgi:hypothetical protein
LIYILSESIAKGDLDFPSRCLFHKRQLHRLTFQKEKREQTYNYLERRDYDSQRRTGTTSAIVIHMQSIPIGFYDGKLEPWFKDAFVTVSADGKLPLVVACDLPIVGHVELNFGPITKKKAEV